LGNDSKGLSKVRQCRVEVPRRPDTWSGRGKHYLLQVPCLRSWVCERVICRCYVLIAMKIQGGQLSGPHSSHSAAVANLETSTPTHRYLSDINWPRSHVFTLSRLRCRPQCSAVEKQNSESGARSINGDNSTSARS
jgi:hypothetical protein